MIMYELYPYFTNDGSVGLYSLEADDIYHSTYGALSESYEKFIIPAELGEYFKTNSEIKVLDICYGIGYNTKSFLNFILENFENITKNKKEKKVQLEQYNAPIGTDNIPNTLNTDTIYTNNVFCRNSAQEHKKLKIYIKAIDTDKNLLFLSPFFKNGKKSDLNKSFKSFVALLPSTNETEFHKDKISKLLKKEFIQKYKLKNEINVILLDKIIEKHPEILEDAEISQILKDKKYAAFFDPFMKGLINFYKNQTSLNTNLKPSGAFLHNIYYMNIMTRYMSVCLSLPAFQYYFICIFLIALFLKRHFIVFI